MSSFARSAVVLAVVSLAFAACSNGGGVEVADAWARSPMEDVGAAYFTVANDGDADDRLVAARTDTAERVEIHETVMEDGQAEMHPVEGVVIPAGEVMAFEPGGYHLMFFDLRTALTVGDTIRLVLTFEVGGDVEVDAEVREFVPGDMEGEDGM